MALGCPAVLCRPIATVFTHLRRLAGKSEPGSAGALQPCGSGPSSDPSLAQQELAAEGSRLRHTQPESLACSHGPLRNPGSTVSCSADHPQFTHERRQPFLRPGGRARPARLSRSGAANGVAQSQPAIAKALGPACGSRIRLGVWPARDSESASRRAPRQEGLIDDKGKPQQGLRLLRLQSWPVGVVGIGDQDRCHLVTARPFPAAGRAPSGIGARDCTTPAGQGAGVVGKAGVGKRSRRAASWLPG